MTTIGRPLDPRVTMPLMFTAPSYVRPQSLARHYASLALALVAASAQLSLDPQPLPSGILVLRASGGTAGSVAVLDEYSFNTPSQTVSRQSLTVTGCVVGSQANQVR